MRIARLRNSLLFSPSPLTEPDSQSRGNSCCTSAFKNYEHLRIPSTKKRSKMKRERKNSTLTKKKKKEEKNKLLSAQTPAWPRFSVLYFQSIRKCISSIAGCVCCLVIHGLSLTSLSSSNQPCRISLFNKHIRHDRCRCGY